MGYLHNKNMIVGVTGGIAAYKAMTLVRRLREQGANVQVVMTEAAQSFITPLSFQAVSAHPVHTSLLDTEAEAAMGHIELARWADAIIIAPATANSMARLASGEAHDLLTTLCLASKAVLAVAPSMNQAMWSNVATQHNVEQLRQRGIQVWGPDSGSQACGDIGEGRMLEPEAIAELAAGMFSHNLLSGKRVMVTAGPTHEAIDPVRFIANRSSGKMGYALAQAAREAGASVHLISGPVHLAAPDKIELTRVETAQQMYDAVHSGIEHYDIFISVAAIADYRVAEPAAQKIKKTADSLSLILVKNPDVLASVAALENKPFCVGFAAETSQLEQYAMQKLTEKNLDMVVANRVDQADLGFNSDFNAATVFWRDDNETGKQDFEKMSKTGLSRELISLLAARLAHKK